MMPVYLNSVIDRRVCVGKCVCNVCLKGCFIFRVLGVTVPAQLPLLEGKLLALSLSVPHSHL